MAYTKIICGKLYDGIHDELQENREILIKDKYIVEVGEKVETPEECKVVDLSNLTVTPGMIDAGEKLIKTQSTIPMQCAH